MARQGVCFVLPFSTRTIHVALNRKPKGALTRLSFLKSWSCQKKTNHIQIHRLISIYIYVCIYINTYIHTDIPTYIHTYRQTDRKTDRQTDGRTDRHTYILLLCIFIPFYFVRNRYIININTCKYHVKPPQVVQNTQKNS